MTNAPQEPRPQAKEITKPPKQVHGAAAAHDLGTFVLSDSIGNRFLLSLRWLATAAGIFVLLVVVREVLQYKGGFGGFLALVGICVSLIYAGAALVVGNRSVYLFSDGLMLVKGRRRPAVVHWNNVRSVRMIKFRPNRPEGKTTPRDTTRTKLTLTGGGKTKVGEYFQRSAEIGDAVEGAARLRGVPVTESRRVPGDISQSLGGKKTTQ